MVSPVSSAGCWPSHTYHVREGACLRVQARASPHSKPTQARTSVLVVRCRVRRPCVCTTGRREGLDTQGSDFLTSHDFCLWPAGTKTSVLASCLTRAPGLTGSGCARWDVNDPQSSPDSTDALHAQGDSVQHRPGCGPVRGERAGLFSWLWSLEQPASKAGPRVQGCVQQASLVACGPCRILALVA